MCICVPGNDDDVFGLDHRNVSSPLCSPRANGHLSMTLITPDPLPPGGGRSGPAGPWREAVVSVTVQIITIAGAMMHALSVLVCVGVFVYCFGRPALGLLCHACAMH